MAVTITAKLIKLKPAGEFENLPAGLFNLYGQHPHPFGATGFRQNAGNMKLLPSAINLTFDRVKHSFTAWSKRLQKTEIRRASFFDSALLDLARLKAGDKVNVEVHEGGTITLTPIRPKHSREDVSRVIKATLKDYARTMKKLA